MGCPYYHVHSPSVAPFPAFRAAIHQDYLITKPTTELHAPVQQNRPGGPVVIGHLASTRYHYDFCDVRHGHDGTAFRGIIGFDLETK